MYKGWANQDTYEVVHYYDADIRELIDDHFDRIMRHDDPPGYLADLIMGMVYDDCVDAGINGYTQIVVQKALENVYWINIAKKYWDAHTEGIDTEDKE